MKYDLVRGVYWTCIPGYSLNVFPPLRQGQDSEILPYSSSLFQAQSRCTLNCLTSRSTEF